MKKLLVVLSFCIVFNAAAQETNSWQCNEIYDARQEVLRDRYFVKIVEIADVTNKVKIGNYDYVEKVEVTIFERISRTNKINVLQKFETLAKSEDVQYIIEDSLQGVNFRMYFDELDQSSIEFSDEYGNEYDISLNCQPLN